MCILSRIGSSNVIRWFNSLLDFLVAWGLSLIWRVRGWSGVGLCWCYFLRGGGSRLEGPHLPLWWACFPCFLMHLVLALLTFYLIKEKKTLSIFYCSKSNSMFSNIQNKLHILSMTNQVWYKLQLHFPLEPTLHMPSWLILISSLPT